MDLDDFMRRYSCEDANCPFAPMLTRADDGRWRLKIEGSFLPDAPPIVGGAPFLPKRSYPMTLLPVLARLSFLCSIVNVSAALACES